ncbi:MAG: AAA family ATPase [Methanobrevibacter boviskoreani]|jgi:cobyric acid synthase|uniref:nucleotide-binding protein n=1 Tax=Methanobrevibacter boviskoreani TaxID=1348249 RepID=UPI0023F33613|nr:AAA family ATPase [Methanobrevibacter boviskoreani]MDD6257226.1 AAA family ATPase [Methanobrevibacter boviskoreani]
MKIGLTYVKGAVPGYENFGHLPTDLVKSNGLVNGNRAHEELDALIIPGGTIVESESIKKDSDLAKEIYSMNKEGKPIVGICSGFQLLANQTDVGRKSPIPIIKEGLGLLDVDFSPLISTDQVEGEIVGDSFLTKNIDGPVTGFHCHTYGDIKGEAKPLIYSELKRINYGNKKEKHLSGVVSDNGNIVGTVIHRIFDNNPHVVENFLQSLDADEDDRTSILERNRECVKNINKEIGIDTNVEIRIPGKNCLTKDLKKREGELPTCLIIGSTGSDSGKTFMTTGLAGILREKGLNVGLIKIGPDIRDIVPGLYLTNGYMEDYGSIKISNLGWCQLPDVLESLKNSNYDVVLIEGVMSVFTGMLNRKIPYSGAEIARAGNIPMILTTGVNKGGIESAAIDITAHAKKLKDFGINIKGIVLNKVYDMDIFESVKGYIESETGIEDVIAIPKVKLEERGATPEVEIKFEDFAIKAYETMNKNFDINLIRYIEERPSFDRYLDYDEILDIYNK